MCRFSCLFLVIVFCLPGGFSQTANAEDITPSHVYQTTENLRLMLEELNLLNTGLQERETTETLLRHPRHVMQKVRECHIVLSKILQAKNIKPTPLPDLDSLREVRPLDVKGGVDHLIRETQKMQEHDSELPQALFSPGKVPADVYSNLESICGAMNAKITPSDIFRVISAVKENIMEIAASRGYEIEMDPPNTQSEVSLSEIYERTWAFMKDLRTLSLEPDFGIPGGVVMPAEKVKYSVTHQEVFALISDVLAETNAIKYALGLRNRTALPSEEDSKTASDLYTTLLEAHSILKKLAYIESQPIAERENL